MEARRKVSTWAGYAPWTTATVFGALTWRNPVAAGLLAVCSVVATSAAIALYRATTLPSLLLVAFALYIGLPAVPLPKITLSSQSSQLPELFGEAVDALATVVATVSEWHDLAVQQWATRPAAFAVQSIGTLSVAAMALAHVPTSSVVWLALCAVLTVPGCVSTGAVTRAQHAAHPSVVRAQAAVVHFLQGLESKINTAAAAVTDSSTDAAQPH